MQRNLPKRIGSRASLAVLLMLPLTSAAEVISESADVNGIRVDYKVVLPDDYDPALAYPTVLAFPGGGQTMRTVDGTLANNWREEAERRGFVVISPAAPEQGLFFQGGDAVFPEFLDVLAARYRVKDGKFHIAGVSNGGASAFHVAATYPDYFLSVTGLPGYLPYSTPAKVEALAALCIYMHVGERDRDWLETMTYQAQQLTDADAAVRFWVERDQGHIMHTLAGPGAARLFEHFEETEAGCRQ